MSEPVNKQRGTPPNPAHMDGDILSKMLEAMSVEELTDALWNELENTTEENYDPEWIDAYLDALNRKEPMPEFPDAETSYRSFKKRVLGMEQECRKEAKFPIRRFGRVWRTGLAAVLTVVCMMGVMAAAQAAGLDVFGAVAHWTENIFSFGDIRSDGAVDVPNAADTPASKYTAGERDGTEFSSLQEALDAYGITEVSEPAWMPEGFSFRSVSVDCWPDGELNCFMAGYLNGDKPLVIQVNRYQDTSSLQIEKTDAPIETFAVNDITVYLLENINNNTAAWATEHYECLISGAVEKDELRQMVLSAYANP